MASKVDKLAKELLDLQTRVAQITRRPQLTNSSIDDGRLLEKDADGNVTQVIGKQVDGTHTTVQFNGPPPPTPTAPEVVGLSLGLRARWDGQFVDSLVAPLDLMRVDLHVVSDPETDPLTTPSVGSVMAQSWGETSVPLEPGTYYARLVSWTSSGKYAISAPSEAVSIIGVGFEDVGDAIRDAITNADQKAVQAQEAAEAAEEAALAAANLAGGRGKVIFSSAAPVAEDQLAQNLWIDTTPIGSPAAAGNIPKRWDGSAWVAVTDKAATDAAAAAAAAKSAADSAAAAATTALTTANGKNKNTRSISSSPSTTGRAEGDRHFTIGTGDKAGQVVKIQTLVTGVWVDEPVNVAVFAGVDAAWINTIMLTADTILSRIIAAEQITSEMIETDFIGARYGEILELIVGQLRTETNEIGDSMILDGATSSFTIWKDETRNEVLFRVGPQGAVNRIPMDTDGISAMGAVVLKSPDSRLDPGAAMTVSAGSVPDPSQPPLLSAGVKPVATWPTVPSGFRMRGISWDAVDGCWIRLLVSTASEVTGLCKVERISTSGASLGSVTLGNILGTLEVDMNSIARVGSSYFVNSFDSRSGQGWGVAKFAASTGAFQTLSGTREGISGRPTLGVDVSGGGINVFEVFQGKLRIVAYAASDLSGIGFADALTSWSESSSLMGMVAAPSGLFSFSVAGSEQYAVITANKVVALSRNTSTGAYTRQSAHDITLDADIVQGGAGFRPGFGWHSTTAAIRTLGRYSTYRSGERAWVAYTDRNTAGNSTKSSPVASMVVPNHRWVIIDLPNPAAAATEQWAYMGLAASLPLPSGFKHRTEPQEGRRIYADPTVAGGAAVPTTNTFPGGSPASFKSGAAAGWELYGDGRSRFRTPVLADEAATKSYVDGQFSDSGWLPVTFASGYSAENETLFGTPAVRVLNGAVMFRGAIRRTSGSFAASAVTQICSIPSAARPAFRNDFQTSGHTTASTTKIYCTAAGDISIVTGPTVPSYVNLSALIWPLG